MRGAAFATRIVTPSAPPASESQPPKYTSGHRVCIIIYIMTWARIRRKVLQQVRTPKGRHRFLLLLFAATPENCEFCPHPPL